MTEYVYEGITLTTIDVVDSPTDSSPNRVVFSASTPGRTDDTTATFIHKVKDVVNDGMNKNDMLLEAEKLTPEEVRSIINTESQNEAERATATDSNNVNRKILFSVHGFNADPRGYLLQLKWIETENGGRFQKFKVIPVLWPSAGLTVGYFRDKGLSKAAGKALQSIVEPTQSFSKSLLCHSMGNRVLKNFADGMYNFDHIFMVAPDVPHDIFQKKYINGSKEENDPCKDGLRIKDMLTEGKGGKIHILYNRNDSMLLLSSFVNFQSRLGRIGAHEDGSDRFCNGGTDDIHPEVKDYLVNMDWTNNSPSDSHNYQFDWGAIAYYESYY